MSMVSPIVGVPDFVCPRFCVPDFVPDFLSPISVSPIFNALNAHR
jgi:hypothetical protein